jgi:hypothetical protein
MCGPAIHTVRQRSPTRWRLAPACRRCTCWQAPGPSGTLTFAGKAKTRDQHLVDGGRKGLSLGNRFLLAETLRQAGATSGRIEADYVVLDRSYEEQACQLTLLLKDGQVTAQGAGLDKQLPGVAPTSTAAVDESAITGGTRAYQGAAGTVIVKSSPTKGDTVTVQFAP